MFHKPSAPEAPARPCACCGQPSAGCAWEVPFCEQHWGVLAEAMPSAGDIEAAATPDEIERVVKCEFHSPLVVLKPGVLGKRCRAWLAQWVKTQRPVRLVAK